MSVRNEKVFSVFFIPLKTWLKICGSVVLIALILLPCIFFLDFRPALKFYRISNQTVRLNGAKTILYWTQMFDNKTFYFGEGDIFRGCEVSACVATYDRSFMPVQDFDALLFHGIEIQPSDLPRVRSYRQKYIFVDFESPANIPLNRASVLDGFYNWTMSYRRDSDIPRTYGYVIDSVTNDVVYPTWAGNNSVPTRKDQESLSPSGNNSMFKSKRKAIAWFVSRCNTTSLRDNYVAQLRKFIDVDIYGKCGTLSCRNHDPECYRKLESEYYFYLSFENSVCQDYVTEKLYKMMSYNVVPIVYGAVNYTEFAPPGSYINVVDFDSPKHLAEHLHYLMDNLDEYAKFFWWKKHFSIDLGHRIAACQMCKLLHDEESLASSTVSDLKEWWSEEKCQNPKKFLEKITRY